MEHNAPIFSGSIPESYERYLVPILFEPYATDLVARIKIAQPKQILELACGTGVVSRQLIRELPQAKLVLTDFSTAMLAEARQRTPETPNTKWEIADACALPFEAQSFDAICCQFGYMFFPDKLAAAKEAKRVLKPGGTFAFNVWGTTEQIPIFQAVELALQMVFPEEERPIMPTPANMGDPKPIEQMLKEAGFKEIRTEEVTCKVEGFPADSVAKGFTHGTPLSKFFLQQGKTLEEMEQILTKEIALRLGDPLKTHQTAIVCEARA